MPQIKAEKIYFSYAEILEALDNFNQLYKSNKIKEKIDYQIWKKLKSCIWGINVEYCYSLSNEELLMFFEVVRDKNGYLVNADTEICSFDVYNSEFGTFFANNYYDKHPNIISNTDYDSWENYKSMRDMCSKTNEIKEWEVYSNYNKTLGNLSVGTGTTQSSYSLNDYAFSIETNKASICGEPIATEKYVDKSIKEAINEIVKDYNKKEKDNMKGFNFNFGPCTGDNIKMSVYGLAIQNTNGEWVSYDSKSGQIMNVDLLNFDGRKFMFKMPVAIKDIAKGDIVIHNKVPMFVLGVCEDGVIAVDVRAGEEKKILPTNSPFGFNFVTKVVSMFNAFNGAPTPEAPFGNFLPFMMMGEGNDIDPFVMCMMMQNMGTAQNGNMFSNPMMMYLLMKDGGADKDFMLPMLMMQSMGQPASEVIKSNK